MVWSDAPTRSQESVVINDMEISRKMLKKYIFVVVATVSASFAWAGNEDRAGTAGAGQLLINPSARSSAWGGAGVASSIGLDAMFLNVAGTAFTRKTEIMFARTNWLGGAGINLNLLGFTQRVSETGVVGFSVMSMGYGDIPITTTELPEGGIGFFSPKTSSIHLSYAKEFSNSIYGGLALKVISEGISDMRAQGVAIDAGVRYVGGESDHIKFGIALRNVGPPMSFKGDGDDLTTNSTTNNDELMTLEQRAARSELPSLVHIGASYDFNMAEDHKLTGAATFTSNSFTKDELRIGAEYGFRSLVILRAGYIFEKEIMDAALRTTALTGISAGLSIEIPFGENDSSIGLDYSYRAANPFGAVHSIGARINLQ